MTHRHTFNWYGNINKLVKAVVVLSIPVGIIAIIFWNIYPITRIILFAFIALVGVGIFDRLLAWSLSDTYEYRRKEFLIFICGIILGTILVSNGILPKLVIGVVK